MSEPEFDPRHLSPEPSSWPFAELLVNSALCSLLDPVTWGFSRGSADRESSCNVGDLGWIPGLGRSPGKGKGYPLQYSGLGHKELDTTEHLSLHLIPLYIWGVVFVLVP